MVIFLCRRRGMESAVTAGLSQWLCWLQQSLQYVKGTIPAGVHILWVVVILMVLVSVPAGIDGASASCIR